MEKKKTEIRDLKIKDPDTRYYGAEPKYDEAWIKSGKSQRMFEFEAHQWYHYFCGKKDAQEFVAQYLESQGKDNDAKIIRKADEQYFYVHQYLGWRARMILRGLVLDNEAKQQLDSRINEIKNLIVADEKTTKLKVKVEDKKEAPVASIQDRVKETAGEMCDSIDAVIDLFIKDPEQFDPSQHKIANLLRARGAKAAHARYIKTFYEFDHSAYQALVDGTAEADLKEAYSSLTKKQLKKRLEFYSNIQTACEQIIAEAKVLKKPRAKRVKPAEDRVKKVKFKVGDDKLGITSVPPAQIIGAAAAIIYNTKSRKLGYYVAADAAGLTVKGTTILDFASKSSQKTLRKPEQQIKEFKEQNTQKRFETWFEKIKTTGIDLNGRLNEDIVILKVFK